jgi:nucleoid DNA-binding protein
MNKNDLIKLLSQHTLTKNDAKKFVNIIFDTIRDTLLSGEKVVIQHFGTFIPKFHKSKKMYNPKQKKYVVLTPRKRIKFVLSKKFSAVLNMVHKK